MARKLPPISKGDLAAQRYGAIMLYRIAPLNGETMTVTVTLYQHGALTPIEYSLDSIVSITVTAESAGKQKISVKQTKHRKPP